MAWLWPDQATEERRLTGRGSSMDDATRLDRLGSRRCHRRGGSSAGSEEHPGSRRRPCVAGHCSARSVLVAVASGCPRPGPALKVLPVEHGPGGPSGGDAIRDPPWSPPVPGVTVGATALVTVENQLQRSISDLRRQLDQHGRRWVSEMTGRDRRGTRSTLRSGGVARPLRPEVWPGGVGRTSPHVLSEARTPGDMQRQNRSAGPMGHTKGRCWIGRSVWRRPQRAEAARPVMDW